MLLHHLYSQLGFAVNFSDLVLQYAYLGIELPVLVFSLPDVFCLLVCFLLLVKYHGVESLSFLFELIDGFSELIFFTVNHVSELVDLSVLTSHVNFRIEDLSRAIDEFLCLLFLVSDSLLNVAHRVIENVCVP